MMAYIRYISRSPRLVLQLLLTLVLAGLIAVTGLVGLHTAGGKVSSVSKTSVPSLVHLFAAEQDIEHLNYDALVALSDTNATRRTDVDLPRIQSLVLAAWHEFQHYQPSGANAGAQAILLKRVNELFRQGLALSGLAGALNQTSMSRPAYQRLLHATSANTILPLVQALSDLSTMDEAAVAQTGNSTLGWMQATSWNLVIVVLLAVLVIGGLEIGMAARDHRHRAMAEHGADVVIFLDAQSIIRYASPTFERLLGYRCADAVGHSVIDYIDPADQDAARAALAQYIARADDPSESEYRVRHSNGSCMWLSVTSVSQLQDPLIRGFVMTCHDVTTRKAAEEALQASEAHLRAVISHAPILLFELDRQGVFSLSEGGTRFTLDDEQRSVVGRSIQAWLRDVEARPGTWERVRAGEALSTTVELHDQVFEVWWSPASMSDASGAGTGVAVNVTERVNAQRVAERARQAAVELAQLRSDFVASVSHELRTPLTAIVGYGELLQAHWQRLDDTQRLDRLGRIVASANRQKRLVGDLLLLSRLEAQGSTPRIEPVCVADLVDRVADEVRGTYTGQHFDLAGAPDLYVLADLDRATQILANLLDNAAKYSPQGASITVTWRLDGNGVVIQVADRGAGIPEASRDRLFTRFGRVPGSQVRSGHVGTGLGLYLGRDMARAMGGELDLESSGPSGSVFLLRLPAAVAVAS